jgi:TRAP-type transport system small permease protein
MRSQPAPNDIEKPFASFFARGDRVFDVVVRGIELFLGTAFMLAVALNFATIIGRYFFNRSILGSDEIQIYTMIWMTFVGAVVVTWRHQHLRIDVLITRLPNRLRIALLAIELLLVLGITSLLCVQSWRYTISMLMLDRRSDLAGLPLWVAHAALAIGLGMIAIIAVWRIAKLVAGVGDDGRQSAAHL